MQDNSKHLRHANEILDDSGDGKISRTRRSRFKLGRHGSKWRLRKKSGNAIVTRIRAESFFLRNSVSENKPTARIKFSPFSLLQNTKSILAAHVRVQKVSSVPRRKTVRSFFPKWEEYYAEVRESTLLLYLSETWRKQAENMDIIESVSAIASLQGCSLSREAKDTVLTLSKNGEFLVLKFSSEGLCSSWADALTQNISKRLPRLSDFEKIAPIGRGAAGKVFFVRDRYSGKYLALKAISKEKSVFDCESSYRHTIDERIVLGRTKNHPFFIQLRYAFQTRRYIYIATDFYDGGDLFYYLAHNNIGLGETRAKVVVAQVILAVEHLHSLGVLYRDLKPENILLDSAGHVRIADFGLCKLLTDGALFGRTTTVCGTHSYVAPEMIMSGKYGVSVDVWTIGIFLYHIVMGRPPFEAHTMDDIKRNIQQIDKIEYFREIMSPEMVSFLKSVLAPQVSDRIGCGEEMLAEVKNHPFFAEIDWIALREKAPPYNKGLYSNGEDQPLKPALSRVLGSLSNADSYDKENRVRSEAGDEVDQAPAAHGNMHLLRNFELSEWSEVVADDTDDANIYGDCKLWPMLQVSKQPIDEQYIIGYSYSCSEITGNKH